MTGVASNSIFASLAYKINIYVSLSVPFVMEIVSGYHWRYCGSYLFSISFHSVRFSICTFVLYVALATSQKDYFVLFFLLFGCCACAMCLWYKSAIELELRCAEAIQTGWITLIVENIIPKCLTKYSLKLISRHTLTERNAKNFIYTLLLLLVVFFFFSFCFKKLHKLHIAD